jgi:putative transposase
MSTRGKIIAGDFYHVLNRGVDKRNIFMDDQDYFRFIHDMYEFNDIEPPNSGLRYSFDKLVKNKGYTDKERKTRKLLVDILAFSLMPNHYHLLLRPKSDNGIFLFMKKLNMGYAKYFNEKYERKGALFEGRYKAVHVKRGAHFNYLPLYIHFNPLDLYMPEWRKSGVRNSKKALEYLENYRWSSHLDYIGKKNFPSITQRDFILKCFGGKEEYLKTVIDWLKDVDLENVKGLTLE